MKKFLKYVFLANIIFLTSCYGKNEIPQEVVDITEETVSCQEIYNLINNNEFYHGFIENPIDKTMKEELEEVMEIEREDFLQVPYTGEVFPESLIYLVQEAVYNAYGHEGINQDEPQFFFDLLEKLDENSYEMTKEEAALVFPQIAESEEPIYQFYLEGEKAYLYGETTGGSSGQYFMTIETDVEGKLTTVSTFNTQAWGYGRVIQYEENYYYIFLQANYNLKYYDGIRIYKLGESAEEENILIRFIPEEYVWKNFYCSDTVPKGIDEYIDTIKDEVTSDKYIDRGTETDYAPFYGDEIKDESFLSGEQYQKDFYKADFTNLGCPIDFWRTIYVPSNGTLMQMRALFYINDTELDALNMETELFSHDDNRLIQMWFKELDGKVYTFQIYHLKKYDYMMNVILIEGNQITQIRKDLLLPKCEIVMTEGEIFWE